MICLSSAGCLRWPQVAARSFFRGQRHTPLAEGTPARVSSAAVTPSLRRPPPPRTRGPLSSSSSSSSSLQGGPRGKRKGIGVPPAPESEREGGQTGRACIVYVRGQRKQKRGRATRDALPRRRGEGEGAARSEGEGGGGAAEGGGAGERGACMHTRDAGMNTCGGKEEGLQGGAAGRRARVGVWAGEGKGAAEETGRGEERGGARVCVESLLEHTHPRPGPPAPPPPGPAPRPPPPPRAPPPPPRPPTPRAAPPPRSAAPRGLPSPLPHPHTRTRTHQQPRAPRSPRDAAAQ